ncbi:hypothetical protein RR46_06802 [Papilio xuthus]|uniref:Uncharacterized protein n=1 Tax=Papilio xuthus TaxID=66420 RepID=A0A194PSX8_PAPXU|nr:hypothetical protein RR46_06802 [Papilio xuthus]
MQVAVEEGKEGGVEEEVYNVEDERSAGSPFLRFGLGVGMQLVGVRVWVRGALAGAGAGLASWIHEGDHDVPRAAVDGQALVVVGEAAGVHQEPAEPSVAHRAVVAQEVAAATGVVLVYE